MQLYFFAKHPGTSPYSASTVFLSFIFLRHSIFPHPENTQDQCQHFHHRHNPPQTFRCEPNWKSQNKIRKNCCRQEQIDLFHERSRFATCQWELLTPTDISIPLTHRLVLYTLEAGDCLFCVHITYYIRCSIAHTMLSTL